jgi:hypothetical protein
MNKIVLVALLCVTIVACKQNSKNTKENQIQNDNTDEELTKSTSIIYGNYIDDSYYKRAEGFDWVAVSVKQNGDKSISVSVRSRADKKRPTCTFDAKAFKKGENLYVTVQDRKKIIFDFTEGSIVISTENQEDSYLLNFFCNGGATIAGTYKKINKDLDSKQIDLTSFSKVLNLQGIGFNVSSIKNKGKNTLSILTFGLVGQDYNETLDIEGEQVINAEVKDLNSDGSPELFVYTQSIGSGSYGNVYAFSVNNKKSMSQIYFQPTAENNKINNGYMGHDEFSVAENSLSQHFPIYKEGDTNANPTGGTRYVFYKLIDGEATRKLVVDKISEN